MKIGTLSYKNYLRYCTLFICNESSAPLNNGIGVHNEIESIHFKNDTVLLAINFLQPLSRLRTASKKKL